MAVPARAPRAAAKRDAILAASITLFGRYGYRRTSMEEIARHAGIAKGTVYLYFPTKEMLFRALSQQTLERVLADAARVGAEPGPLAERLAGVLAAKYGYFHAVVHSSPHAGDLIDSKNRLSADVFARGGSRRRDPSRPARHHRRGARRAARRRGVRHLDRRRAPALRRRAASRPARVGGPGGGRARRLPGRDAPPDAQGVTMAQRGVRSRPTTRRFDRGLAVRRRVLGARYVDDALRGADAFTRPLQELVTEYCWGAVWTRPGLPKKTRSLLTLAMLTALNRPHEVRLHVRGAVRNGCTRREIMETLLHAAVYCGVPAAIDSVRVAREVLAEPEG